MKLARIEANGATRLAVVLGHEVIDLSSHLNGSDSDIAHFLAKGPEAHALVERCIRSATASQRFASMAVRFRAPIAHADKIIGIGMNYRSFVAAARELGLPAPPGRLWFYRPTSCLAGPYDEVWLPRNASDFDYEAELAIVIGQRCHRVAASDARKVIAGFTIANDLTLREQVMKSVVLGKSFDTHTPIGPWLVTPDEIEDPQALGVQTWVNGEIRQRSTTSDMIASCYELIAELSFACILDPGDLVLTGTPAGSGIFCLPPRHLAAGDVVRIEIERIGAIENRVVDAPEGLLRS